MKKQQEINIDKIIFSFNEEEKTAEIIGCDKADNEIIIPISINYKMNEYFITRINRFSFQNSQIQSIQFLADSKIRKIEEKSFVYSSIKSIMIPSSVDELEEGWCCEMRFLTNIKVNENNQRYQNYNGKFVIGKTDIKSDNFDVLIFASRDIKNAIIPSFIKKISSYAFADTKITSITIPPHIIKICEGAFLNCKQLKQIKISNNSELQIIEKNAFKNTKIENISIPSSAILEDGWCSSASNLKKVNLIPNEQHNLVCFDDKFILGKTDPNSDIYDVLVFANRDIKNATIPPHIKIISSFAFAYSKLENIIIPSEVTEIGEGSFSFCKQLQKIEFEKDSKLQIIGKSAFSNSKISGIVIPPHVNRICEDTFSFCFNFKTFSVEDNSELRIIEANAFRCSALESITIPSSVEKLENKWCIGISKLTDINIIENERRNIVYYKKKFILGKSDLKSDQYDILAYARRDLKKVKIPKFIKQISSYAFSYTQIESVVIPPHIEQVDEGIFSLCQNLRIIEIEEETQLNPFIIKRIETKSASVMIPSKICRLNF